MARPVCDHIMFSRRGSQIQEQSATSPLDFPPLSATLKAMLVHLHNDIPLSGSVRLAPGSSLPLIDRLAQGFERPSIKKNGAEAGHPTHERSTEKKISTHQSMNRPSRTVTDGQI